MSNSLKKVVLNERIVKQKIDEAYKKSDEIIEDAILEGTILANKIHEEAEKEIHELIYEKNAEIEKLNIKMDELFSLEKMKVSKKISEQVNDLIDTIYKEAISSD